MKYSFILGKLGKESTSAAADSGNAAPAGDGDGGMAAAASASGDRARSGDMAADFVSDERFADNFWSPDERCISVLMHKLKSAKQTCGDVQQLVATRAGAEEELGKRLGKLARSALGSEEVGGLRTALRTMRAELETNARAHSELARQLRGEIERPLAAFVADQRDKRRAQTTVIQKIEAERNALRSQLRKLQDKRRSDTKKVGDLDLQVNGLQGVADPKLRAKLDRVQRQQRDTEDEYRGAKARLRDVDRQWFNMWRSACDVFQRLEEERIEYLKTALWTYTNLVSSSCVADDESMERMRQDLERVSVADDIAEFIHTFGTGAPDPDLAGAGGDGDGDGDAVLDSHRHSTVSDSAAAPGQPAQPVQQQQPQPQQATPPEPVRAHRSATSTSAASVSAIPAPDHAAYASRAATPGSNAFASISTGGGGTARSGSIMAAHAAMARPQTQESMRQQQQQQQRPVSMHAVGGPPAMQPQAQAQHLFAGGSGNWNSRPASSMQGSIGANNTFRRASNNDMYAMAAGTPPQQQPQPQQQFVQRTNSQIGMYAPGPMDPRAPSSVGMYRAADAPVHAQQPPMADANGAYGMSGFVQPPHLGSPRSRASTFNGAQGSHSHSHSQHHAHHVSHSHTGQFGTLTANTQMAIPQQGHANSAPNSPYQHAVNASSRPMSAAGMHGSPHAHVPPMQYGAVGMVPAAAAPQNIYRSSTPVQQQQQQPQYANAAPMVSRPPTQMSQMHPMAARNGSGYQTPQPQQQQQQHHGSPAAANGAKTADSDKILFYVKVLYDYDAENEKELTIRENDVISVFAVSADGWWDGEMTDRRTGRSVQGTFPSNFTEPISH